MALQFVDPCDKDNDKGKSRRLLLVQQQCRADGVVEADQRDKPGEFEREINKTTQRRVKVQ